MKLAKTIKVDSNFMLEFSPVSGATFELGPLLVECGEGDEVTVNAEGKSITYSNSEVRIGVFEDKVMIGKEGIWEGSFYLDEKFQGGRIRLEEIEGKILHCDYYNSLTQDIKVSLNHNWRYFSPTLQEVRSVDSYGDFCLALELNSEQVGLVIDQANIRIELLESTISATFSDLKLEIPKSGSNTIVLERYGSEISLMSGNHRDVGISDIAGNFTDAETTTDIDVIKVAFDSRSVCKGVLPKDGTLDIKFLDDIVFGVDGTYAIPEHDSVMLGVIAGESIALTNGISISSDGLHLNETLVPLMVGKSYSVTMIRDDENAGYNVWVEGKFKGFANSEKITTILGNLFHVSTDPASDNARHIGIEFAPMSGIMFRANPGVNIVQAQDTSGNSFKVLVDSETPGGPWVAALSFITTPKLINLSNVLAKSFTSDTYTRDAEFEPVLPTGLNVHVEKTLVKHSHPSWVNEVGDWVVLTNRDLTDGLYLKSEGVQAWNEKRGEFRLYDTAAGWWGHPDNHFSPVFGLMTKLGNSGLCGGSRRPGVAACPIASPRPNSLHFDGSHLTQVFFKLI